MIPVLSPNDPYFNNVSLLLSARDWVIKDYSKNNLSITNSGVTVSSVQAKWGNKSFYFNNNRLDGNLLLVNSTSFTCDFFVYISSSLGDGGIISTTPAASSPDGWQIRIIGTKIRFAETWAVNYVDSAQSLLLNQWNHVCCVRNGNNAYIFINGIKDSNVGTFNKSYSNSTFVVGNGYTSGYTGSYLSGYLSEIRVTNNVARHISNFPIPTQTFPAW